MKKPGTMAARRNTFKFNEEDRGLSAQTEVQPLLQSSAQQKPAEDAHEWVLMQTLEALREAAHEPFDDSSLLHMQTLHELWEFSFPGEPFSRSSRQWATLGFQGLDPTTDLRGGGFLALRQLHQFVTSFQVLPLSCPSDFPLAIASINCTAILISYFGLNSKVVVPVPDAVKKQAQASSRVHRAFLELASKHPQATYQLNAIHAQLLHALARQWARTHTPTTTIMDFPYALQATYRHFHLSVAATAQPWAMHELVSSLQQTPWLAEHGANASLSQTPVISFLLMLAAHLGCCAGRTDDADDYLYQRMDNDRPLVRAL